MSEERFVDRNWRLKLIYFGVPACILLLLVPLFRWLARMVGQDADVYVIFGIALVVIVLSWVLCDSLPSRLLIPLVILAWILTFGLGTWYLNRMMD